MSKTLRIYIGGDPVGQPRARHAPNRAQPVSIASKSKRVYITHVTELLKREAAAQGYEAGGLVRMEITSYYKTPQKARWGAYCGKKPDWDNLGKLYADAAQKAGLLPQGDERIAEGSVSKVWSRQGGVLIVLSSLADLAPPDPEEDDLGAF